MKSLTKGFLVVAGLLAQAPSTDSATLLALYHDDDPRLIRLRQFFLDYGCPAHELTEEFLLAADENGLDWRLLPTIALVESGGGREYANNNIFGWDNGRQAFPTVRDGIHIVASRLSKSKLYRDKDLTGILRTYNRNEEYARKVLALMERLGPADAALGYSLN